MASILSRPQYVNGYREIHVFLFWIKNKSVSLYDKSTQQGTFRNEVQYLHSKSTEISFSPKYWYNIVIIKFAYDTTQF